MKRFFRSLCALVLCISLALTVGCASGSPPAAAPPDPPTMKQQLLEAAQTLAPSTSLYFPEGLTITGMSVNWSGEAVKFEDNYYWTALERLTGTHLDLFWEEESRYISTVACTLLTGIEKLPDIMNATDFGIMDMADDGVVIPLDEYLSLMPDIVAAVGEERMANWRQADGHIYTIPSIVNVPGAQTVMVRRDWLDQLGLDMPQTWEEWLTLWRAIRDNDLNGNGDPTDEIPFSSQITPDGQRSLMPLLNAFGIRVSADCQFCVLDDGTYTLVYEHPRYPAFLEAMQQLYAEGLIDPAFDLRDLDSLYALMDENRLGTTYTWAEKCRVSSEALREAGVENALWEASAPICGPYGDQLTSERGMVSHLWCITSAALQRGKVEDILRFFNWCFTPEGSALYSYGIEGVSYTVEDGAVLLAPALTQNGFTDYREAGCNIESFGGLWQKDAFMQCLFGGQSEQELDPPTEQFYRGISLVNDGYFYSLPRTYETAADVRYHTALLTTGMCYIRNDTIRGELTLQEYRQKYAALQEEGLQDILSEAQQLAAETSSARYSKGGST